MLIGKAIFRALACVVCSPRACECVYACVCVYYIIEYNVPDMGCESLVGECYGGGWMAHFRVKGFGRAVERRMQTTPPQLHARPFVFIYFGMGGRQAGYGFRCYTRCVILYVCGCGVCVFSDGNSYTCSTFKIMRL